MWLFIISNSISRNQNVKYHLFQKVNVLYPGLITCKFMFQLVLKVDNFIFQWKKQRKKATQIWEYLVWRFSTSAVMSCCYPACVWKCGKSLWKSRAESVDVWIASVLFTWVWCEWRPGWNCFYRRFYRIESGKVWNPIHSLPSAPVWLMFIY